MEKKISNSIMEFSSLLFLSVYLCDIREIQFLEKKINKNDLCYNGVH